MGNDISENRLEVGEMPHGSSHLRRRAEELPATETTAEQLPRTGKEALRLLHELQVHQLELEMQNVELRRIRDEVETALEKYADLFDFAPVGYFTLDSGGIIRSVNFTGAAYLGGERSRLIGRRFGLYVAEESRRHFTGFLGEIFAGKEKKSGVVSLKREENAPFFIQMEAVVFGAGEECRVAVLDITERKLAQEALRQKEERLTLALDAAQMATWDWHVPSGAVVWNEKHYQMMGYEPGEVKPTYEAWINRVHHDDRDAVQAVIRRHMALRQAYTTDFRTLWSDGTIRWLEARGNFEYDADGRPFHCYGVIVDTTEQKLVEQELHRAHNELEVRVDERTEELRKAIRQLTHEVEERKEAEDSLREAYAEITRLKDRLQAENIYLRHEDAQQHNFGDIIGHSSAISHVFLLVKQVAPMNATVLLLGETGVGKGVIARAIHSRSARKERPLITVNCASLPANLVESELFGRERGAFTGAGERQIGRFELADGGTIFLDEIGEMPLELQSKLLRVIQDGEFERLGGPRTIKVDVRIIAASNRVMEEEIRNGRFRNDLFYRLNVFPILLPPLRQRPEDIPLLVTHFVAKFNKKMGKKISSIPKDTLKLLQQYHWPGNVRELESVIERAVITSRGNVLEVVDRLDTYRKSSVPAEHDIKALAELEQHHILQVLQQTGWRIEGKGGAALILGLNPSTLRARIRKYGILRH